MQVSYIYNHRNPAGMAEPGGSRRKLDGRHRSKDHIRLLFRRDDCCQSLEAASHLIVIDESVDRNICRIRAGMNQTKQKAFADRHAFVAAKTLSLMSMIESRRPPGDIVALLGEHLRNKTHAELSLVIRIDWKWLTYVSKPDSQGQPIY